MKLQKILISFLFLIFSFLFINISFGAINMTISPIKYELTANTGSSLTREAQLTNYTNSTIHIITGKSDFVANGEGGAPTFIRRSEEVFEQELSDWITIDTPEFDIAPQETKTINFTINIPSNATPGGHYGAVFFKNNNSETSAGTSIGINVDYGVLILLEVSGEISTEIEIADPIIRGNGGSTIKMDVCNKELGDKSGNYYDGKCSAEENTGSLNNTNNNNLEIDDCVVDLSSSKYDGICIDNIDTIVAELTGNIEKTNLNINDNLVDNSTNKDDFKVEIVVPVKNKGNTHVKPTGKITLIDENGNIIKKIGKKIITNKKGAIIGEQIVDYIPFNDNGGNILPGTQRIYDGSWKGFPYKDYDPETGEQVIKYWDPSEYYSNKNLSKSLIRYPWQRVKVRESSKDIKAKFNIIYQDENGEDIEYNSAKDFEIKYKEKYLGLNPYFFIALFIGLFIIWLVGFIIIAKKKIICINNKCNRKIDKDMKICPYCLTNQEIKKKKIDKKPIIIATKKQNLKTKELDLKDKVKKILIENKLKYASDLEKLTKEDLLKIKGIGEIALKDIKKALKKENLKIKK